MTTDTSTTTDTTTDTSTTDQAQQAATTATDEAKHVAGVAADEARSVAADAKNQVRDLAGQALGDVQAQVEDQSRLQKDRLAGTLTTFGDDLGSMAANGSGLAADVAHEVADRARALARHLDGREPQELLDDVRRFARQRPGTFLLSALAAGVVVGRLARSTKDAATAADAGLGTQPSDRSAAETMPPVAPRLSPSATVTPTHSGLDQPLEPVTPPPGAPVSATPPTTPPTAPPVTYPLEPGL